MNYARRVLSTVFALAVCLAGTACSAQLRLDEAWNVIGEYSCSRLNNDSSQEQKLFLLPDMSWERTAPFTPQAVHVYKIDFQTRNLRGRLMTPQADMTFTFADGVLRLYREKFLADPEQELRELPSNPLMKEFVKKLDQPSALGSAPASPLFARQLVQSFRYDARLETLTEASGVINKQPLVCSKGLLFSGDPL